MVRKPRAQPLDRAQPFREEQRRAGFQPVHPGGDPDGGGLDRFVERDQVERQLNDRVGEVIQIHSNDMVTATPESTVEQLNKRTGDTGVFYFLFS